MTVDNLLLKIMKHPGDYARTVFNKQDFDILTNLTNSIIGNFFITEGQSRLLLRILKAYQETLTEFSEDIGIALENPMWSRKFRHIDFVKKLYIEKYTDGEPVLTLECNFSGDHRKLINEILKEIDLIPGISATKKNHFPLTEQNIVVLVEKLTPHKFDIDQAIKDYYETIKSWNFEDIKNQYLITTITHPNFQRTITNELGFTTAIDQNIIADRSVRYNYFLENPKNFGENLTEIIANRGATKIFVDKTEHTLSEVFSSITDLKRFPILVVFEASDEKKSFENLEILSKSLEENGIFDGIGIYFRMPNTEQGKQFNSLIADKKYNAHLDSNSKVVAVQSGKIPKFFLKTDWKPMSVIALDTKMGLRHGKTSVYSNKCDLIIEYADSPSVLEQRILFK